jgi:inorganic phosphate transporter, PiT family
VVQILFYYISFILIIAFIFITGFHDEGNLIATIIASRSLNIYFIFFLAFISQLLGTLFLGTKVAMNTAAIVTVSSANADAALFPKLIFASISGALIWNLITWKYKIPSSSSHALVGGLMGPFALQFGLKSINWQSLLAGVVLPLFTSPLIGYVFGYLIYRFNYFFFCRYSIRVKNLFKVFQIITCVLVNAFQGSNDAQKGMGIFVLLLVLSGQSSHMAVPDNIVLIAALSISFGLVLGGVTMIKSVGTKIFGVRTIHSVSAQISSLAVIVSASIMGFPISGTQIVNSSIMGVGAADRPNAVGWLYAKSMLAAWMITIPASFILSALIYLAMAQFY